MDSASTADAAAISRRLSPAEKLAVAWQLRQTAWSSWLRGCGIVTPS